MRHHTASSRSDSASYLLLPTAVSAAGHEATVKRPPLPYNPAQAYGTLLCCSSRGLFICTSQGAACGHVTICGGSSKGIARLVRMLTRGWVPLCQLTQPPAHACPQM